MFSQSKQERIHLNQDSFCRLVEGGQEGGVSCTIGGVDVDGDHRGITSELSGHVPNPPPIKTST